MSLVHNEQVKLSATYPNGLAIAVAAVGGIAPVLSYALGSVPAPSSWIVASAAICLFVPTLLGTPDPQEPRLVSNLEFVLLFSIMPIGALLIAGFVLLLNRDPKRAAKRD